MPPSKDATAVGVAVRARRTAAGRTLTDLATACECTAGFLSQIESGQANPTLQVLSRLAAALGTTPGELLGGAPADRPFTPVLRRRPPTMPPRDGRIREYSAVDAVRLRATMVDGTPDDHGTPIRHAGEEMCLVLSGRYTLTLGETEETLADGDFAHYPADLPHSLTATTPGSTALLVLG